MRVYYARSEEHTSELQSHLNLVCRLLLEKRRAHVSTPATLGSRMPSSCLIHKPPHPQPCSFPNPARPHDLFAHPLRLFVLFFFKERRPPQNLPFSLPRRLPV